MTCGHIGFPCYSKVKMRGHQCYSCRSVALSNALRLTDEEATAVCYKGNSNRSRPIREA